MADASSDAADTLDAWAAVSSAPPASSMLMLVSISELVVSSTALSRTMSSSWSARANAACSLAAAATCSVTLSHDTR